MNKYRVERVVGEGSFGKALLCSRKSDNKKCIVKEISLSRMGRKEAKQTEQESSLLSRLQHPNIVTFWEAFQDRSTQGRLNLYIVMEFADGGDLSGLIKSRRNRLMSENQVSNITVQIALAMKHVHDRKILHRDLKSQNIFLTSKGIVKLGDFGIARVLRNTGELASTQIGTPYFMSPEILANKRYNNKTDIWSLGCVVFELMCLRVPFQGNSMKQLVSNIINSPMPSLPTQYSSELRSLVKSMLAKNYKERPSINTILSKPVVRDKITHILDDHVRQREFSHTVLHGDDILRSRPAVQEQQKPEIVRPVAPAVVASNIPAKDARLADQLKEAEVNSAALAAARERQAARARQQAVDAHRGAKEREVNVDAQMRRLKELREANLAREKELLRLKRAAEENDRERAERARVKAQEARERRRAEVDRNRERPWRENANAIGGKKNAERAPIVPSAAAPSNNEARYRPRMKPAVPKRPVELVGEAPHSPDVPRIAPKVAPKPRVVVRHQVKQASPPIELRVDGKVLGKEDVAAAEVARERGVKVNMSAAQERRERYERLRAQGQLRQQQQREKRDSDPKDKIQNVGNSPAAMVAAMGNDECGSSSSSSNNNSGEIEGGKDQDNNNPVVPGIRREGVKQAGNWFKDLEQQMGALKNQISDMKAPASVSPSAPGEGRVPENFREPKKDEISPGAQNLRQGKCRAERVPISSKHVSPPAVASAVGRPPVSARPGKPLPSKVAKKSPPVINKTPPPSKEEQLERRRQKRDEDRKNLRQFVRAQRAAQGVYNASPASDADSSFSVSPSVSTPQGSVTPASARSSASPSPSVHSRRAWQPAGGNLKDDLSKEPMHGPEDKLKKPNPTAEVREDRRQSDGGAVDAAAELRRKRDKEREDLRRMIAAKRSEKAAMIKQRAKEREEKESGTTDDLIGDHEQSGRISNDVESAPLKIKNDGGFVIYDTSKLEKANDGGEKSEAVLVPDECSSAEDAAHVHTTDENNDRTDESQGAKVPNYCYGDMLHGGKCDREGKNIKFQDFLGQEYSPLSSAAQVNIDSSDKDMVLYSEEVCNVEYDKSKLDGEECEDDRGAYRINNLHDAKSGSFPRFGTVMYSRDDIDVHRKRAQSGEFRKQSRSCCDLLASCFSSRDERISPVSPLKKGNRNVEERSKGEIEGARDDVAFPLEYDVEGEDVAEFSEGDSSVVSGSNDDEFGSMLLAMQDALAMPARQPVLNEDGIEVEEDGDEFEEEEDGIGDESGDDESVESNACPSDWSLCGDDEQHEYDEIDVCDRGEEQQMTLNIQKSPIKRKTSQPLAAYFPTENEGQKNSKPVDVGPEVSPTPDEILQLAENLLTKNRIAEINGVDMNPDLEDVELRGSGSSLGSSWGENDSATEEGSDPNFHVTVYGVPFPLNDVVRSANGIEIDEDHSPASRMEALREYLEDALGVDKFIKAYRLLKAVDPKDDDDALLASMEAIVGVDGLHYMDAFIQLITIEDRFESS